MMGVDTRDITSRYFSRIQGKIGFLWDESLAKFPDSELIAVAIVQRDESGDERSTCAVVPRDAYMREAATALSPGTNSDLRSLERLPKDQIWLVLMVPDGDERNGTHCSTYFTRMRRPSVGGRMVGLGGAMHTVDDRELMAISLVSWRLNRGERSDELSKESKRILVDHNEDAVAGLLRFGIDWAECAYPKLVTSHKYAAALMCTTTRGDDVEDLHIPWPAFLVVVPDGLLGNYDRLRVWFNAYGKDMALITLCSANREVVPLNLSLPRADMMKPDGDGSDDIVTEEDARMACAARRLVAGLLLSMQHTDNFRETVHPQKERGAGRRGDPEHRVVFIGRPLSVDCRRGLRDYIEGDRKAPPSVQVLVRGHYRRQVVGVGRTGRKVIWIEPFWRGPEDAPILAHPYKVGP